MSVSARPLPSALPPPPSAAKPRRYHDDEDDRQRRRRDRDDLDEDDFDDFPDSRRFRQRYLPHRGGLIMALGLVALVGGLSICVPLFIGPIAWAMGTWDLREIREGRMDPEGTSMTQTGQVCGIVATVLLILSVPFLCFVFGVNNF
jgi:hypothetical protein